MAADRSFTNYVAKRFDNNFLGGCRAVPGTTTKILYAVVFAGYIVPERWKSRMLKWNTSG